MFYVNDFKIYHLMSLTLLIAALIKYHIVIIKKIPRLIWSCDMISGTIYMQSFNCHEVVTMMIIAPLWLRFVLMLPPSCRVGVWTYQGKILVKLARKDYNNRSNIGALRNRYESRVTRILSATLIATTIGRQWFHHSKIASKN